MAISREAIAVACIILAFFAAWELLARAEIISALFFPPPSVIARTLWDMTASGELVTETMATLWRVSLGFIAGGAAGLFVGLLMGYSRRVRALADPFVAATHPMPKIALLPLLLIVFGFGENARVILIALAAFYPVLLNAMAGVREIHPLYFQAAENYGARGARLWTRVILPGSLPAIIVGARIALNLALLLAIAVEMVSSQNGLGQIIWLGWETLRVTELYAALFVIALLGIGLNLLLETLARRFTPWRLDRES